MSLLLDALNKTSGQTKPAEQQTPDPEHNQPAEAANSDSSAAVTSPLELTLEAQDCSPPNNHDGETSLRQAAEIEVDVDIDEDEFSALLDASNDLSLEVQQAASEATLDGDAASALDSIDRLSEEIAEMPSIPSLARAANQDQDEDRTDTKLAQTSQQPENLASAAATAIANADDDIAAVEVAVQDSNGHLIIESHAEPESLAEEIQQDAPLVQAYSQAQKKRGQALLLIAAAILLVAAAIIYKLLLGDTSVQANASSFDPVTQPIAGNVHSSVVLEEIDPNSIPERLILPEFSSSSDVAENIVLVAPPQQASIQLRRAYTALRQGRLEQAKQLYTALSNTELNKVAALSGLASVAIAQNDINSAREHLRHVLSVNRHNVWAAATLAALPKEGSRTQSVNGSSLSQLKSLRTTEPDNHHIAYLLGNRFAATGIWTEAQAAYFDAFTMDSQNANYAFNLAISLDHLGKAKQASDFYLQALQLAETRGADFDVALLRKRLQRGGR